ncbi:hypothetical protein BDQ17DRAFT_1434612 [Cyathus striatus]|nr:hypothetical protein BDQ17DRAFT_1434612 [Cyathus striatus]
MGVVLYRTSTYAPIISLAWDPTHHRQIFYSTTVGKYIITDFKGSHTKVLTGTSEAPCYAIAVGHTGQMLALAVGPEIHISKKLNSGLFATVNILPDPEDLHPEDANTIICACAIHFLCDDSKVLVIYRQRSIVGNSSLSSDSNRLLISDYQGSMAVYSIQSVRGIVELNVVQVTSEHPLDEPIGTIMLNNGGHACGELLGHLRVWNIERVCVSQIMNIDGGQVRAIASLHLHHHSREFIAVATNRRKPDIKVWVARLENKKGQVQCIQDS